MTPTGFFQKKARRPERFFTLIEVLAAMAVLSLLMLMLFMFFGSAQKAWSHTEATSELFENGRVIFDIIQRDLQSAVARQGDIAEKNIEFKQNAADQLWFVTNSDPSSAATCELVEVGYKLENNAFKRAFRDNSNASWTPYDNRTDPTTQDGYQEVASGVLAMTIVCMNPDMITPRVIGIDEKTLPAAVMVQIQLLDKKSFNLWERLTGTPKTDLAIRKGRTFSKVILLGNRQ